MSELLVEKFIGVHTADAEGVELQYRVGSLRLVYVDWQGRQCEIMFNEVRAFRWQELDEQAVPRDDTTYEVLNSQWLASHAAVQLPTISYAHSRLCFNTSGTLDVLCEAQVPD